MSAPSVEPPVPHWRKLYEDAILELDLAKIPGRVTDARKAIQAALLAVSSEGKNEDCERLVDCLNVLDDLLKMYKRPQSTEQ